jgi:hypothetical protein
MAIVANNPNVNVLSLHYDRQGKLMDVGLRWGAKAAAFLLNLDRDIQTGRLVEDNSEQYGEVVGYELDSPQNSGVTDDRKTIDNKGTGQNCDVSVSFSGDSINGMKNGENYFHGQPGLGFTVSISGLGSGGIAKLGENEVDPKGSWVLQQLMNVTYWTLRQRDITPLTGHVKTWSDHVHPASIIRNDTRSGGWIDHPGPNLRNEAGQLLISHHSKWNFLIKAFNGNKQCFVGFHAEMTFRNGVFTAHWGPGLY